MHYTISLYSQPRLQAIVSWALKQNLEVPISIETCLIRCFLYLIKSCPASKLCITCRHRYHMRLLRNLDPCLSTQKEKSINVRFWGQLCMQCRTCNTFLSCNCKNNRFNKHCKKWLPAQFVWWPCIGSLLILFFILRGNNHNCFGDPI